MPLHPRRFWNFHLVSAPVVVALTVVALTTLLVLTGTTSAFAANWSPLFGTGEHFELGGPEVPGFPPQFPVPFAAGDFNGDGRRDLVAPNVSNGNYRVLYHTVDSDYPPMYHPTLPGTGFGGTGRGAAVTDFNDDGKDDIILGVGNPSQPSAHGVWVYRGTGGILQPAKVYPTDSLGQVHAAGDLNGDDLPDVVITKILGPTGFDSHVVAVMYSVTADSLGPPITQTVPDAGSGENSYPRPVIADADNDGFPDIVWSAGEVVGGNIEIRIRFLKGNGAGSFTLSPQFVPTASRYFAVGDLNNDGNLDVVGADSQLRLTVALGAGSGAFHPAVPYVTGLLADCLMRCGDIDQDGDVDIVALRRSSGLDMVQSISVLRNNGNGTFAPFQLYAGGMNAREAILEDADLDGRLDLIMVPNGNTVTRRPHSILVIRNDGAGGFLDGTLSAPAIHYTAQAVADFNRDGKPDLAVADSAALRIGYGNGDGTYSSSTIIASLPYSPSSLPNGIVTGDIDRDGWIDMGVTSSGFDFTMYRNDGVAGTFTSTFIVNGRLFPRSLADLNQDGWLDLVYADQLGLILLTRLNIGGFFDAPMFASPNGRIQSLAVADWNRDAIPDVMVATEEPTASVQLFLGSGGGFLQSPATIQTTRLYSDLCVGDFNRDGRPDLAARENAPTATPTVMRGVDVWLGNGSGAFGAPTTSWTFEPAGKFIDTWDANRDGIQDLVALGVPTPSGPGQPVFSSVDLFLGGGGGGFGLRTTHSLGVYGNLEYNLRPIAVGDMNRDGAMDILAPVRYSQAGGRHLNTVLANPPSRGNSFKPTLFTQTLNNPIRCAVGDLNRDGRLDVVTVSHVSNPGVAVHLNTGSGTLGPQTTLAQAYYGTQVQLADLNRDGILDIVAASYTASTRIYTMLGAGDGTFGPRQDRLLNAGLDFEVGDMNRDGTPDVVTSVGDSIQVLIGNGNGTFTPGSKVAIGSIIYDLDLADLNRDGVLDVAVASNVIRTVQGNANGTLGAVTTLSVPITFGQTLCVADFNRDGYPDIQSHQANVLYVIWGGGVTPFSTYATTTTVFTPFNVEVAEAEGNGEPYLYITRNAEWLEIVKVASNGALTIVGSYAVSATPVGLALGDMDRDGIKDAVSVGADGSFVAVTLHGTSTIVGVEHGAPPAAGPLAALGQNVPNPFNPSTEIRFMLRDHDRIQLRIHDVHGRVVATLADGTLPSGAHVVRWTGRNANGESAASGVYFYRLTTASGFAESRRMVLVK